MSRRSVSWVVLGVGALGLVGLAWWLVPWHPVPWEVREQPAASSVFTAEQIARAEAFAGTSRWLSLSALAVSMLVASVLGFTSLGRRLVARVPGPWPVVVVLATLGLLVLGRLATLPFALLFRSHRHAYGLSDQSLGAWTIDQLTGLGVGGVFTSLSMLVLVGSARRWERAWPAIAGTILAGSVLVGSFAYPVLVEPLFNDFSSLPDGPLRSSVFVLADREGVQIDDVLVADASRRTTTLNAYVSGFGDTRRVVLYDNLVNDVPADEALSVVAHELGHARHNDVLVGSALGALGVLAVMGLLGLVAGGTVRRRGAGAIPLVLALAAWGTFLGSPLQSGISRQVETRADVAALQATHDPAAFIAVQRQLAVRGLSDPTPPAVLQWWFGSHPTALQRIAIVGLRD